MATHIEVVNPFNKEVVGTATVVDEAQLSRIMDEAKHAKKMWRNIPLYEKNRYMEKFLRLVEEHKEELAQLLTREMGKPIRQSRDELDSVGLISRSFIQKANHLYGEVLTTDNQPGYEQDLIFTKREPLGIIACIIPFNYPVKLFIHKVIPALLMGNVVVAKVPNENPLTIMKLYELFQAAGFPRGVITCFLCEIKDSNKYLTENAEVQGLSLTGSTRVGIQLIETGAKSMKRMFMELGGNDGTIVREDADLDFAVEEITRGRMVNAGQTCCACKRILVHNHIKEKFAAKLVKRFSELKVGDPLDEEIDVGTLISEQAADNVKRQIDLTVSQGARILYGGNRDGAVIEPTILAEVTRTMDIAGDMEVFGPVVPIIGFDSDEEALEIVNQSCYGLSSGIITRDTQTALRMAAEIEAGAVILNGQGNYRHTEQGFGGVKMTGFSREGVSATLEEFSRVKHFVMRKAFK